MPDDTPNLAMPFIMPAQAQKHVTHNEALLILDAEVQLCLEALDSDTPPPAPQEGQVWAIGAAPTGLWNGQAGKLAIRAGGGWIFAQPHEGWLAWDRAAARLCVWRNAQWDSLPADNLPGVGINTSFDAVNRLAVASPATLLSHEGAGHQVKVNKAAETDTASLLFQSNWSGRAEMGLAGEDAFSVKVSADGTAWQTALRANPGTGRVALPGGAQLGNGAVGSPALSFESDADTGLYRAGADQLGLSAGGAARVLVSPVGVQINTPVTGTAVTQNASDATAGRLTRVGDFGLGGPAVALSGTTPLKDRLLPSGNYSYLGGTVADGPEATVAWVRSLFVMELPSSVVGGASTRRVFMDSRANVAGQQRVWIGANQDTGAIIWREIYTAGSVLGTVSQSGGIISGALRERISNANGRAERDFSGSMECWRDTLSAPNASTAAGARFRSTDVTWTFPSSFLAGTTPVVTPTAVDADCDVRLVSVSNTQAIFRVMSDVSKSSAITIQGRAKGIWSELT